MISLYTLKEAELILKQRRKKRIEKVFKRLFLLIKHIIRYIFDFVICLNITALCSFESISAFFILIVLLAIKIKFKF